MPRGYWAGMSEENVETIARLYDEFLAKPERLASSEQFAYFDPAVELHQSESLLGTQGTFHGYDGLGFAGREVFETFRAAHYVPKRLVDAGDQVVATVEFRAIGKESGVRVVETVAHVWTLKGGRITAWHVYIDPAEALEAVELSE
jgi:ketosteroid isomerase-like protein